MAVRYHDYKAHFVTRDGWNLDPPEVGEGKEGRKARESGIESFAFMRECTLRIRKLCTYRAQCRRLNNN